MSTRGYVGGRGWTCATAALAFGAALLATPPARAQLVVSKTEATVEEAHFIAVREGNKTVMFLRVTVDDTAKGAFDVVVPVPSAKTAATAATVGQHAVFSYLDNLAAPRLVEYWEQDPCEFHTVGPDDGVAERDVGADAKPNKPAALGALPELATVADLTALTSAMEAREHTLTDAAKALLTSSKSGGFVVATAAPGETSVTVRWELDAKDLRIPTSMLRAHHANQPRVIIDVLGGADRYEAANRENLAAPANTNVVGKVKGSTNAFHDAVLNRLFESKPDAVVTEYAWHATSCAPCPGPPLSTESLVELGVGGAAKGAHEVMIFTEGKVTQKPDGPPALRSALMACYDKALAAGAGAGEVTVAVDVADGKATTAKGTGADAALVKCAEESVKATAFDGTGNKGAVKVQFSPVSRKFVADLVVTRLRARVGDKSNDVVLRAGAPIGGGAEVGPTGGPKVGAYAAPKANHFQSRYTVRHKWKGKEPDCLNPNPGKWGGPPKGVTPKPAPGKGLTDPGKVEVDAWLDGDIAATDKLVMRFPPRKPVAGPINAKPPTAASATPSAHPAASSTAEMPTPTAPKAPGGANPDKQWVGYLALLVCAGALYMSQRAQT